MKRGTRVFALTMILTLLLWTMLPVAGAFAVNIPTITISTPANNLVTGEAYIDIQGYVTEQATLEIDNERVSTSPNGYFSYRKQPLVNGTNRILITAVNSAGSDSEYLTVIYDPTAVSPTIVVTSAAGTSFTDGMVVSTSPINLECSVNNIDSLSYTINGGSSITVSGATYGTVTVPGVLLNSGDNTIILTATKGTRVVNRPIHIIYSGGGPEITNISPNGVKVGTNKVVLTGIVKNAVAGGLKMYVNGAATGTVVSFDSAGNFQTPEVTLNPGDNSIRFEATNGVTTVSSPPVSIRYEASPTIVITSPKNNDIMIKDSVVITGKVFNTEPNGLTINDEKVSFYLDGTFSKTVRLDKIENNIRIKAANGSLVNTANLTVYFSGIPSIDVTYPAAGDTVSTADVVFQGSIFPTDNITEFTIEGAFGGPKDNRSTISGSTFSSFPVPLDPSSATDVKLTLSTGGVTAGSVYLPPRTVTRTIKVTSNVGPLITVSSPVDGATVYSNNVTVNGKLQRADFNSLIVDGIPTKVSSDGSFSQTIALTSGKKDIKIEAKLAGTQDQTTTKTISVYYDPVATEGAVVRTKMTDGGEAKAFNDMVKVKLTKGTAWMNTTSVLTLVDPDELKSIPSQTALVGPMVLVGWSGEKPLQTYKVTLKYDDVVRDNQAHKVTILYYEDWNQKWVVLGGVVDSKAKTISIQSNRSGYFAAVMNYQTFDDLPNHWGQRDIEYLVTRGAIPVNTTYQFHPDAAITRAEFIMFLVKALGIQPYHPDIKSYDDLQDNSAYYDYIEAALRAGLIVGVSHDRFAPDQNITREEAAVVLARAGNLKALKEPDIIKILGKFTDEKSISSWARNQLASAVKSKILNGSGENRFDPRGKTTRAQAASMIVRLTEILNKTLK